MEHCSDHSALVQTTGRIEGKVGTLVSGQESIFKEIGQIAASINEIKIQIAKDEGKAEVEKQRIRPVFWIGAAALYAGIVVFIGRMISLFWPIAEVAKTASK